MLRGISPSFGKRKCVWKINSSNAAVIFDPLTRSFPFAEKCSLDICSDLSLLGNFFFFNKKKKTYAFCYRNQVLALWDLNPQHSQEFVKQRYSCSWCRLWGSVLHQDLVSCPELMLKCIAVRCRNIRDTFLWDVNLWSCACPEYCQDGS